MMLFSLLLTASLAGESVPESWPSFRGRGDSVVASQMPSEWNTTENIAWKIDLPGYGQSCPVIWNKTIYLTAVEGEQREKGFVVALDIETCKEKWRHTFEPTQKAKWSFTISRAAPTPCVDNDGVYTFFEGGNVLAFSHDGKLRWERLLVKEYGEIQGGHGLGSSPTQTKENLIILVDHRGPSYLVALDKKTGKNAWKTDREPRGSWTSPVVADRQGKPEVIVSSNGEVAGYDAQSGKLSWRLGDVSGNTLPSASVQGDLILVGGGASRSKSDAPKGTVYSNFCLKLTEKEGKPSYDVRWSGKAGISNYATPLAYRGYAYFVNQVGVLFCYDLKTGKECYSERIDSSCWASPVGAGNNVYFFGKNGITTVVKVSDTFEKVSSNPLWDEAEAKKAAAESKKDIPAPKKSPNPKGDSGEYGDPILYGVAAADGSLFLRTGRNLFRIGKK
jgi:outer membrane protein assembly factor BamB